jgi:hypothetical protein
MREPDHFAGEPYLRLAHARYCEALQLVAVIISHLPSASSPDHAFATGQAISQLDDTLQAARQAYFTYVGLISGAEGEA